MRLIPAIALALAPMVAPLPAFAQQGRLIIYGDDPCPSGNICVVAPEKERYRIPKPLRDPVKSPESTSWAVRQQQTLSEGKTGTDSCSAVGGGGWTGCFMKQMQQAYQEDKQAPPPGTYPDPDDE